MATSTSLIKITPRKIGLISSIFIVIIALVYVAFLDKQFYSEVQKNIKNELNIITKSNYFDLSKQNFRLVTDQIGLDHANSYLSFKSKNQELFKVGSLSAGNICESKIVSDIGLELTLCKPYERKMRVFYIVIFLMIIAVIIAQRSAYILEFKLLRMIREILEKAGVDVSQCHSFFDFFNALNKTSNQSKLYKNEAADLLAATSVNNKSMHIIHEMSAEIGVIEDFVKIESMRKQASPSRIALLKQATDRLKLKRNDLLLDRTKAKQQLSTETKTTIDIFSKDLKSMCDNLVNRSNKDIKIKYEIIPSSQELPYSRIELTSVLTGLVKNSIEAIPKQGNIVVAVKVVGNEVVFGVNDDGPGLSSKELESVSKFTKTSKKPDGSGGGLFFIAQLVKSYLGYFNISSIPGKVTGVTVKLPLKSLIQ